tara:strand:- start:162 stop:395 length:234 start_codon:yes stop_codon:yes gene_type:complete
MNIKIYGADWCSDCIVIKRFFQEKGLDFKYITVTDNEQAIEFLEKVNNGKRIIPTIVIQDKIYSNPGIPELIKIIEE